MWHCAWKVNPERPASELPWSRVQTLTMKVGFGGSVPEHNTVPSAKGSLRPPCCRAHWCQRHSKPTERHCSSLSADSPREGKQAQKKRHLTPTEELVKPTTHRGRSSQITSGSGRTFIGGAGYAVQPEQNNVGSHHAGTLRRHSLLLRIWLEAMGYDSGMQEHTPFLERSTWDEVAEHEDVLVTLAVHVPGI